MTRTRKVANQVTTAATAKTIKYSRKRIKALQPSAVRPGQPPVALYGTNFEQRLATSSRTAWASPVSPGAARTRRTNWAMMAISGSAIPAVVTAGADRLALVVLAPQLEARGLAVVVHVVVLEL